MLKTNGVDLIFCSREGSKINVREKSFQHEMSSDQPVLQQRGEQVRAEETSEAISMKRPAAIWDYHLL